MFANIYFLSLSYDKMFVFGAQSYKKMIEYENLFVILQKNLNK